MKIKVEINDSALAHVYEQIAEKIKRVDSGLRSSHAGKSVDEILPSARDGFAGIGLNLPDNTLREYSESIASGKDFKFVLN